MVRRTWSAGFSGQRLCVDSGKCVPAYPLSEGGFHDVDLQSTKRFVYCAKNAYNPFTTMALPTPTDAELALLHVLWSRGPATVRAVHEALAPSHEVGYTTVLKLLQIMAEKGLVSRDTSQRAHVYEAAVGQEAVQQDLVRALLERAFGGSAEKLVLRALSVKGTSAEELDEIRALLDKLEKRS